MESPKGFVTPLDPLLESCLLLKLFLFVSTNKSGWSGSPSRLLVRLSVLSAPENLEDGKMYLLVPAYPGCPVPDKVYRAVT